MTDQGVTFINVIDIPADRVDEFVEQWHQRATLMRAAPGFRDVRLHRALLSDTRFQLVNVAHWDSVEACEAAGMNPTVLASVDTARKVASANPGLYEVVAEYLDPHTSVHRESAIAGIKILEPYDGPVAARA